MRWMALFVLLMFAFGAQAAEFTVSGDECSNFTGLHPDDNGAYIAGVDADGKSVDPVDANDNRIEIPKTVTIPIELELADTQELGSSQGNLLPIGKLKNDAKLGQVSYDIKSGEFSYEGKKLSGDDQNAILAACKRLRPSK